MSGLGFDEYLARSYDYLKLQQEICYELWGLDSFEKWSDYTDRGELSFSNNGGAGRSLWARYQLVGTFSKSRKSWTWSWDHPLTDPEHYEGILEVKAMAKRRGWDILTHSFTDADEADAWQMTALAAYHLGAKGAYRLPITDDTYSFYLFTELYNAQRA